MRTNASPASMPTGVTLGYTSATPSSSVSPSSFPEHSIPAELTPFSFTGLMASVPAPSSWFRSRVEGSGFMVWGLGCGVEE